MSAATSARSGVAYGKRARSVWMVMLLSTLLFCAVFSAGGYGAYGYLTSVTRSEQASVERIRGQQLLVLRHLHKDYEAVEKTTTIDEGDQVTTGTDTEANLVLFDRSTVHLYFSTQLELTVLRASRFMGSEETTELGLSSGTIVVSTAPEGVAQYSSADYTVSAPDGVVELGRNSTVRAQVSGQGDDRQTQVVLTFGTASVRANGRRVELQPGQMSILAPNQVPTDARPAEQQLISNGNFEESPTSGKETIEGGGLGTAAWQPILEQASDNPGGSPSVAQSVKVMTETLPGQTITAAWIHRDAGNGIYARVGVRQDINAPASFLKYIALSAAVKVGLQTEPVSGPQGDVFPLTIKVLYTDTDGKPQSWQQSFYVGNAQVDPATATNVPLGAWQVIGTPGGSGVTQVTPTPGKTAVPTGPSGNMKFVLKQVDASNNIGQNISVINAIEIYAIGDRFQSWVTDVSLIAQ